MLIVGAEFKIKISCDDNDAEDTLTYFLMEKPEGMVIKGDTGYISWKPLSDQTGSQVVRVRATDGMESSDATFYIEVEEEEKSVTGLLVAIGAVILIIILVVVILLIFLGRRKRAKDKNVKEEEEAREIAKEIEQKQHEHEWEEAHMHKEGEVPLAQVPTAGAAVVSDVPLSAAEAHLHDHEGRPKTYEELYGKKMSEE